MNHMARVRHVCDANWDIRESEAQSRTSQRHYLSNRRAEKNKRAREEKTLQNVEGLFTYISSKGI